MKKIMIDGMSCQHCVAHVKEALEELGATSIEVNLDGKYAKAETSKNNQEIILSFNKIFNIIIIEIKIRNLKGR